MISKSSENDWGSDEDGRRFVYGNVMLTDNVLSKIVYADEMLAYLISLLSSVTHWTGLRYKVLVGEEDGRPPMMNDDQSAHGQCVDDWE